MDNNQNQAIFGALGYPMALPQGVSGPYTTNKTQVQRTIYEPNKLKALMDALGAKRNKEIGTVESIADALAGLPEAQSFKGAYGVDVVNPWAVLGNSAARAFGGAYSKRKDYEREQAEKEREDAIKAAQIALDADKQVITDTKDQQYFKINNNANGTATPEQQAQQKEAAISAIKELKKLSRGGIGGWNNEADSRWNSPETARKLGRRDQALSALIPMTNAIAKASGGSGINTLGEMMAYLGVPENATSKQIEGVLPGLIKKLGLEDEIYGKKPTVINGFTIEEVE